MALESILVTTTIAVPGTCGELIQGWSADWAEPILVSCPISRYSQVRVQLCPTPQITVRAARPADNYFKSRQAARLLLDSLGWPDLGAEISFDSQLLPGRGMASSTADVTGVMAGLALALNQSLSPTDLARLACQIEPSDSTMFAGLALLAYRGSGRAQPLGLAPELPLLMLDPGQIVDTLSYNAHLDLAAVRQLAPTTQAAIELLNQGVIANDAAAIGAAATLSSFSYQAISYNPLLELAQAWAKATTALGVVRAHSGSLVGLLYAEGTELTEPASWLAARFRGSITPTCLTGGGYLQVDSRW